MKKIKENMFIVLFLISFVFALPFLIKAGIKEKIKEDIHAIEEVEEETEEVRETETEVETEVEDHGFKFTSVDESYFDDALFIGDSRTVGLFEYSDIKNATFFANSGMNVYNIFLDKASIPNIGKLTLEELLARKQYSKIYLMLGINELGYNMEKNINKYEEILARIQVLQPSAIIIVEANLHVTKTRSDSDKIFNNENIDIFNNEISKFADYKKIFYLDINSLFDDETGSLREDYTSDNAHVLGKHYVEWGNWLLANGIIIY